MKKFNKNLTAGEKRETKLREEHKKDLHNPNLKLLSASLSEYRLLKKKLR